MISAGIWLSDVSLSPLVLVVVSTLGDDVVSIVAITLGDGVSSWVSVVASS